MEAATLKSDDAQNSPRGILSLVGAWVVFWVIGHYVFWPLWKLSQCSALLFSQNPRVRYRRRICRSQVYCFLAVVGGIHLLSQCKWHPRDLLYAYSEEHQLLFSMAAGHWLVAVWEDLSNWRFLSGGLSAEAIGGFPNPDLFLLWAYSVHHAVAFAAFMGVMYFRTCTGIGVFGLIFELPVLLMNHREFAVHADTPPEWFRDSRLVESFWSFLQFLFMLARGGPSFTYFYSLAFWWDDLSELSYQEIFIYHFMAIFFTVLNYCLTNTFLIAWAKKDLNAAIGSEESEEGVAGTAGDGKANGGKAGNEDGSGAEQEEEEHLDDGGSTGHLVNVSEGSLAQKNGETDGELWLEVDGIAYNVTDFLDRHPGGAAVLRKFAGKDASQGFHRARHSMNAKMQMQKFAVGPISRKPRTYRIYEHDAAMNTVVTDAVRLGGMHFMVGFILPRSHFGGLVSFDDPDLTLSARLAPGLIITAMGGSLAFLAAAARGFCLYQGFFTPGTCLLGASATAYVVAFALARQPLPAGAPPGCPTGLELGVWGCFFLEEVLEFLRGSRYWSWRILLGLVLASASWAMRGAPAPFGVAPGHALAGVLFVATTYCISRRVVRNRELGETEAEVLEVVSGLSLSGPMSLVALYCLSSMDPVVQKAVATAWATPLLPFSFMLNVALGVCMTVPAILNASWLCTPAWSVRLWAVSTSIGIGFAGGLSSWRWLALAAWFAHMGTMGARSEAWLTDCIANDTFKDVPEYAVGTRSVWDLFRSGLATVIWQLLIRPTRYIVSSLMPEELCFFANSIPAFELGDDVDLGVAAYFAPQAALKTTVGPEHFVCNVGHVDTQHPHGVADLQMTMNALRDVWTEFKKPTKGLLANIVCFFPRVGGTSFAKQINVSCWQSSKDANAWYAKSASHKEILRQHAGGGLQTFGNLLAPLQPHGKIRHQDRCSKCARLVESDTLGEHAPSRCRTCGGDAFGYAYF